MIKRVVACVFVLASPAVVGAMPFSFTQTYVDTLYGGNGRPGWVQAGDGDGDLDVVAARYTSDLGWWENPGGPLSAAPWPFHRLGGGGGGWFLHDLIRADLDRDGDAAEFLAVLQRGYWDAPFHVY